MLGHSDLDHYHVTLCCYGNRWLLSHKNNLLCLRAGFGGTFTFHCWAPQILQNLLCDKVTVTAGVAFIVAKGKEIL